MCKKKIFDYMIIAFIIQVRFYAKKVCQNIYHIWGTLTSLTTSDNVIMRQCIFWQPNGQSGMAYLKDQSSVTICNLFLKDHLCFCVLKKPRFLC